MSRAYSFSDWHRDFARAFAAAVPLESMPTQARGTLLLAQNTEREPVDEDLCRFIATVNGKRTVFRAYCDEDAQVAARRMGATEYRDLVCTDPEAAPAREDEHDIYVVDPRSDPDARGYHFQCRLCGRREWHRDDFEVAS